ncbi:hypothetical protein GZL_08315 [Streptomyces sp. 769]|nr:hypothetical protein GZL_08315 [Streptomyces sp. 769]
MTYVQLPFHLQAVRERREWSAAHRRLRVIQPQQG